jgi:hypothetical protein
MTLRLRYQQLGDHIHCRLFTARAKCGDLVFDEQEWPMVRSAFESIGEVMPEDSVEFITTKIDETSPLKITSFTHHPLKS